MEVINYKDIKKIKPNVSCIGYFDGVHIGHKELIKKTVYYAKRLCVEPCLITFYPDPKSVVKGKQLELINSFTKRLKLFEKYGIKKIIVIDFNEKIMKMSHEEFTNNILNSLKIKRLICGFDFSYGKNGKGNIESLSKELNKDTKLTVIPVIKYNKQKVSSSLILKELSKGHIKLSNKLLGYDYSLFIHIFDTKIINNLTYCFGNVIDQDLVKLKSNDYIGYLMINKYRYFLSFNYKKGIVSFVLNGKVHINKEINLYIES